MKFSSALSVQSAEMTATYGVVEVLNEMFFVSSIEFRQILNADRIH